MAVWTKMPQLECLGKDTLAPSCMGYMNQQALYWWLCDRAVCSTHDINIIFITTV